MIPLGVAASGVHIESGSYNLLTDWTTPPIHGVWANDPDWTPPSDGAAVSTWRNGGSVGTPDFTQATPGNQPTFDEVNATYGDVSTVYFDGGDAIVADVADVAQTFWVVAVADIAGANGVQERILGLGGNNNRGMGARNTDKWILHANTYLSSASDCDGDPHLFVAEFNGASSTLDVDGTNVASGDANTTDLRIACLGSACTSTAAYAFYMTGDIHFLLIFTTDPTAQSEWSDLIDYVENTVGIAVA